jgi:hypothetical protein
VAGIHTPKATSNLPSTHGELSPSDLALYLYTYVLPPTAAARADQPFHQVPVHRPIPISPTSSTVPYDGYSAASMDVVAPQPSADGDIPAVAVVPTTFHFAAAACPMRAADLLPIGTLVRDSRLQQRDFLHLQHIGVCCV